MASGGRRRSGFEAVLGGPTWFDEPLLPAFPVQCKSDFGRENLLRSYNSIKFDWLKRQHGYGCVVQMYHAGSGSGRRFFRYPMGFVSSISMYASLLLSIVVCLRDIN